MAVCDKVLEMYEVQEGYYACENQDQIADWLTLQPEFCETLLADWTKTTKISALVTYEKGSFHVYFLVSEHLMGDPCLWLLYVPNFLSKHFDLLCFKAQYPELDIEELFADMSAQFHQLSQTHGHPLPVSGCNHKIFSGFMYDVNDILCQN
ncbi:MAG: hypothetical protein MUD08_01665 [Cytophagales bacterium]|nr:hypothetical protein [Cytophagales bacterium]